MVLTEKYKKYDYIDESGFFIWINRYGEILKKEDENGNRIFSHKSEINIENINQIATLDIISQEVIKKLDIIMKNNNIPTNNISLKNIKFNNGEITIDVNVHQPILAKEIELESFTLL